MAISIKPSHKGKLHRALGIAPGARIPERRLEQAAHSRSPALRREAQFALNARHFKHK